MKNNKLEKIINLGLKYGTIIVAIIVGIIGILSIFITAYLNSTFYHPGEKTFFKYSFGIIEILITTFVVLLIAILNKKILKKIPSKILIIILLICSSALFVFWVKILKLTPETDQKLIHEMALYFMDGNISHHLQKAQYLFLYPYQFGLTFFVSIIYKFFGTSFMNILYVNCACSVINMFIIYYISKMLFKNENVQKILIILLSGFALYWMFFNPHFYGNIIGLTFALISVLFVMFYLENNHYINLIVSGVFIALSILIKTNYQIFLCGIILILSLYIIKKWKLKTLLIIPAFFIGYFSINLGYSAILKYTNVDLPKGVPMIGYIYMGMDEPTSLSAGWYNGVAADLYHNTYYNYEKTSESAKQLIKQRLAFFLQNPKEFLNYYSEKIGSTWLNPTFQTIWCSLPGMRYQYDKDYAHYLGYHEKLLSMVGGDLYKLEEHFFNIYQIIIFCFASIGIFKLAKNIDLKKAFLLIIFIGGFVFHIIWETKAIYVIQYYFLLLPFAAFGLDYFISNKIANFKEQNKQIKNKK